MRTLDQWSHARYDATGNAVSKDRRAGPPRFLQSPVPVPRPLDASYEPEGSLRADLDGRKSSYFEWLTAARYRSAPGEGLTGSGGAMHRADRPVLDGLRFGFDRSRFLVRVDPVKLPQVDLFSQRGP